MKRGALAAGCLLILLAGAGTAAEQAGRAAVSHIVDGDTLVLTEAVNGASEVRLVGIQAPKLPLGRPEFKKWPYADEAKDALTRLTAGQVVSLKFVGRPMDRHGRHLAHLYREDGTWIQGAMLQAGLARVYSFADNRALVADMLALERLARTHKKGIWGLSYYAVRGPEDLTQLIGTFQLVEGRVLDAATVRGTTYLNFGADWRTDFTVVIDKKALKLFAQSGMDPLSLKGADIRVRGWLSKKNGPTIQASHPEQIEILSR